MDTLFGMAVVGVWIAISAVGLKRALGSGSPSPQKSEAISKGKSGSSNSAGRAKKPSRFTPADSSAWMGTVATARKQTLRSEKRRGPMPVRPRTISAEPDGTARRP